MFSCDGKSIHKDPALVFVLNAALPAVYEVSKHTRVHTYLPLPPYIAPTACKSWHAENLIQSVPAGIHLVFLFVWG